MGRFSIDNNEIYLLNTHPSKTQQKYGRPHTDDISTMFKSIDLKEHLKIIHGVDAYQQPVNSKLKNPKKKDEVTKAEKKQIRNVF